MMPQKNLPRFKGTEENERCQARSTTATFGEEATILSRHGFRPTLS